MYTLIKIYLRLYLASIIKICQEISWQEWDHKFEALLLKHQSCLIAIC
jgi:hypothetical protein